MKSSVFRKYMLFYDPYGYILCRFGRFVETIDNGCNLSYNATKKQCNNKSMTQCRAKFFGGGRLKSLAGRLSLDFHSDEPITLQIVRQIKALVAEGVLNPGDQLPTVRELAIDLRINFSTVSRAYRILDEQRLISTQRGRGTYIWDEDVLAQGGDDAVQINAEQLDQLARRFITEAVEKGAELEQIEEAFTRQVKIWRSIRRS
jgi:GntR family transcriptional regulator